MNLIKRKIDKSKCNILEFREFQYSLIPELISICMEYMKVHGFKYNEKEYKASVIDDTAYNSKYSFSSLVIKVETNNNPKIQTFLEFVIPKLIEGQMFKLNGTLYCPQLYFLLLIQQFYHFWFWGCHLLLLFYEGHVLEMRFFEFAILFFLINLH